MEKGKHCRRLYRYFSAKNRKVMKQDYLDHFNVHPNTFFGKMTENSKTKRYFSQEEVDWFEKWALDNGMPEHLIERSRKQDEAATVA